MKANNKADRASTSANGVEVLRWHFTLIERVPMRRTFLVNCNILTPPIVHFGREV